MYVDRDGAENAFKDNIAILLKQCLDCDVSAPLPGHDEFLLTCPDFLAGQAVRNRVNVLGRQIFGEKTQIATFDLGTGLGGEETTERPGIRITLSAKHVTDPKFLIPLAGQQLKHIFGTDVGLPGSSDLPPYYRVAIAGDKLAEVTAQLRQCAVSEHIPPTFFIGHTEIIDYGGHCLLLNANDVLANSQILNILREEFSGQQFSAPDSSDIAPIQPELNQSDVVLTFLKSIFPDTEALGQTIEHVRYASDIGCYAIHFIGSRFDSQRKTAITKTAAVIQTLAKTNHVDPNVVSQDGSHVYLDARIMDAHPGFLALMQNNAGAIYHAPEAQGDNLHDLLKDAQRLAYDAQKAALNPELRQKWRALRQGANSATPYPGSTPGWSGGIGG